jgi:hypothetical protein
MKLSDMPEAEEGDLERESDADDDLRRPALVAEKEAALRGGGGSTYGGWRGGHLQEGSRENHI